MIFKFRNVTTLAAISVLTGCMAGGNGGLYGNNGQYGNMGGNTGQYGGFGNNGGYNQGAVGMGAMGGIEMAVINAIIQSMSGNVLNGQIGTQLAPTDQSFRLKQLGSMLQSGNIAQAQQWVNPQTGHTVAVNPIGQQSFNPQTRQNCQKMEERSITQNGQHLREERLACQSPQNGTWNFVQ